MTSSQSRDILLITLEFPPDRGGVSRYYGEIAEHWPEELKIWRPVLSWPLWPHWLPLLGQTQRIVRQEGIKMLWVGQVLPLGYIAWWLKKRKKIPYLVFTHGMDVLVPQKSRWKKIWLKKILKNADLVVANSEFTKGEVAKLGVAEDRVIVVYPCTELEKESGIWNLESGIKPQITGYKLQDKKVILSVGRLVKRKGFDKVLEIMPRLLKRAPNLLYVIVGHGEEISNLKSQISNLKLDKQVVVLEDVSDEELCQWYQSCDVFALPCRQIGGDVEGFGLVFLEAALAGKPVIAGRSGGAPEATRHGYGGFVVGPESNDELYQALVKILTDESFANRMGEYGREWVKKNFKWEKEIDKLKVAMSFTL